MFVFKTKNIFLNVPIKGATRLKQQHSLGAGRRRRLQFESLWVNFMLLYVVLQPNWGLEWVFVEVSRSRTDRDTLGRTPPNKWTERRRGR